MKIPLTDYHPTENGICIEVGGGEYPREGYYHVGLRFGMPLQDIQASFTHMPFKNNSIAEILSVAVFEHLDWQFEVGLALQECIRVLRPGGMFKCYAFNLRTMARKILNNEIPFGLAINWTYGGRHPYPGTWHKGAFDKDYMTELLEANGYEIVLLQYHDDIWVEAKKPEVNQQ